MARCGIASKIEPALPSCRTASRRITRYTWQMAGRAFCWVMEDCATGGRILSSRITRRTFGAEFILLPECSTSTTPATTATGGRWWFRAFGRMWNSRRQFPVLSSQRRQSERDRRGELQDTGEAVGADFPVGSEIARARIGHQIALLGR